jgi:molecular chaperone HscB
VYCQERLIQQSQRDIALHVSNAVNAAYKALSSPLHRIEYILQRNGFNTEETDQLEDLEFISEIMEVREEIETGNVERLRALEEDNDSELHISQALRRLITFFLITDKIRGVHDIIEGSVARKNWEEVKAAAVRLKYLHGIAEAIKQRLDGL